MRTNLYIDGFNLYYRALKDTPFRWLDLWTLASVLFPGDDINMVCYFTARLGARPSNPNQPRRQLVYLRALATLPGVEIHYGVFRSGKEKGSDVNLATRLLVDGFNGDYEQAAVISNDADFAGAMRYVRDGMGLRVTLVNPDSQRPTQRDLVNASTYVKRLRKSHLRQSLLPGTLTDHVGVITKPPGW